MTTFPLGAVLSVTTGILVAEFGEVHALLEHLVGEPLFTHSLTVVAEPCAAEVLRQRPQLAMVAEPELNGAEECATWVAEQVAVFGAELEIAPMKPGSLVLNDQIADLVARTSEDRVIALLLPAAAPFATTKES